MKQVLLVAAATEKTMVLGDVVSTLISTNPYEMKITFDDNSRLTVNLNHILTYAIMEDGESK